MTNSIFETTGIPDEMKNALDAITRAVQGNQEVMDAMQALSKKVSSVLPNEWQIKQMDFECERETNLFFPVTIIDHDTDEDTLRILEKLPK